MKYRPLVDWNNSDRNITATWTGLRFPKHLQGFGQSKGEDLRTSVLSKILNTMVAAVLVACLLCLVAFASWVIL